MKITLTGAARGEMTGSAYFVETKKARVLVDCAMFQGGKNSDFESSAPPAPFEARCCSAHAWAPRPYWPFAFGPKAVPNLREFEPFEWADLVFLESTYGDRNHRPFNETVDEFVRIVEDAVSGGGKVLVPTFAAGRAQLLIGILGWMFRCEKVQAFPVFLESPMATQSTKIYGKHREIFDDNMKRFIREKPLRDDLVTLKSTVTSQGSP